MTLHEKHVPATLVKATEAQEISHAGDLLRQARALLLRADRSSDLRTALVAVREVFEAGVLEIALALSFLPSAGFTEVGPGCASHSANGRGSLRAETVALVLLKTREAAR